MTEQKPIDYWLLIFWILAIHACLAFWWGAISFVKWMTT